MVRESYSITKMETFATTESGNVGSAKVRENLIAEMETSVTMVAGKTGSAKVMESCFIAEVGNFVMKVNGKMEILLAKESSITKTEISAMKAIGKTENC